LQSERIFPTFYIITKTIKRSRVLGRFSGGMCVTASLRFDGVRRRLGFRLGLLISASVLAGSLSGHASAQTAPAAPVRSAVDGNGVDLFNGTLTVSAPAMTIGGSGGMSFQVWSEGNGWTDSTMSFLSVRLYDDGGPGRGQ
jgi:hypothetical protein